ncbi:T9SS type A sorting domain-containing protein [Candidatus Cloacimonadota bacterium]
MKRLVFLVILIIFSSIVYAIEVGGHLTEDTIWSPDNNPYLVTGVVYVDDDVTLTINPGTIIKFNDAILQQTGNDDFWFSGGDEPVAKMIRVEGNIIAEGTEQDSIVFTRISEEAFHHWGTIYLTQNADLSIFKHCLIEYSGFTGFSATEQVYGGVAAYNGLAKFEKCSFVDNRISIHVVKSITTVIIKDCDFYLSGINLYHYHYSMIRGWPWHSYPTNHMLVANNTFNSGMINSRLPTYFVNNSGNYVVNVNTAISLESEDDSCYAYGNEVHNYDDGVRCDDELTSIYIKGNEFDCDYYGLYLDAAYIDVKDNFFEGCKLDIDLECTGKVYNNYIQDGYVHAIMSNVEYFNNIIADYSGSNYAFAGYKMNCDNNIFYNNITLFSNCSDTLITNCIILSNDDLIWSPSPNGTNTFRNCIIDFPLDPPFIDGGGNIIVDSIQAQSIFVDIQNGDFHLAPGSIAIDAGFDTLGYYYPLDMDYNHRVWDGDGNGTAIIDIGPYEFESPAFGGIHGITLDLTHGQPVDYVFIKINNDPGDFTFSDSIGYFEHKLPAGVYDVYAERVFYDDAIEYQVEVIEGEFTQLDILMYETVGVEEYEIIPASNDFNLRNYPNPFNPSTTIKFSLQNDHIVELSIFNIKGQKVKTMINDQIQKGSHSIIWSGVDEKNKSVSSGIYLYKIVAGNKESVKRMLLLK